MVKGSDVAEFRKVPRRAFGDPCVFIISYSWSFNRTFFTFSATLVTVRNKVNVTINFSRLGYFIFPCTNINLIHAASPSDIYSG